MMADFNQAIKWLREGKKIRMSSWREESAYIYRKTGDFDIFFSKGNACQFNLLFTDMENWEIFKEEAKSLSNHIRSVAGESTHMISKDKVKEAVNRLKSKLPIKYKAPCSTFVVDMHGIVDEIFGEKLI